MKTIFSSFANVLSLGVDILCAFVLACIITIKVYG
jgi:hypothetical protein